MLAVILTLAGTLGTVRMLQQCNIIMSSVGNINQVCGRVGIECSYTLYLYYLHYSIGL